MFDLKRYYTKAEIKRAKKLVEFIKDWSVVNTFVGVKFVEIKKKKTKKKDQND